LLRARAEGQAGSYLRLVRRGNALRKQQRLAEALDCYDRALTINPDLAEAYNSRGLTLKALRRFGDALDSYDRALRVRPQYADVYYNRGNLLRQLGHLDAALQSYERALAIQPDLAEAHNNRGNTLKELVRFDEALDAYERALKIRPDYADACNNRGIALAQLGRFADALNSHEHALRIKPGDPDAYYNRGNVLKGLGRHSDALDSYQRALKIAPDFAEAYNNRGATLQDLKRYEEALDSYQRALRIKPDCDWLQGNLLLSKLQLCDWHNLDAQIADLSRRIDRGEKAAPPGAALALIDSGSIQRETAEIWAREMHPVRCVPLPIGKRPRRERIRVGYFSADFRNHPVSLLTAEMFERHDRLRFEVHAYSFGPDAQDEMRERLERAFDSFMDVRNRSDQDIVRIARSQELDIAVDLGGFTAGGRPNVFAMRAAPLQVSYLGYLGTMGPEYMDYLIADKVIIPADQQRHYAERIAYLPSYQVNDSTRVIPTRRFTREQLGLPANAFVFCCFNAMYKISPGSFDSWMRILSSVPGSVLLLLIENDTARRNLGSEAQRRGVDASRLVFGPRLPAAQYFARYMACDLFLDTLPHNAGATASDALWAGLPVLTRMGESFAARVAASLLTALGMPELIATTQEQYESMAVEIANAVDRLREIREKLNNNRLTAPLFDCGLFTRTIEDAYAQMYERYQADLRPDHIYVTRSRSNDQ
jgi:predicted O-linked N-acetylglucosamine transferase (SPINDLY family)